MHFCTVCQNMYYIRLSGEDKNKLIYYCRKCGHEDDALVTTQDNICVSKTDIKSSVGSYEHIVNKYTKLDPTLPHIENINCPNVACKSNIKNKDGEKPNSDVLYVRYDDANMKFVYICTYCDTLWKSADDK